MGNAASVDPNTPLDQIPNDNFSNKPGGDNMSNQDYINSISKSLTYGEESSDIPEEKQQKVNFVDSSKKSNNDDYGSYDNENDDDDDNPTQLLQQYIPYYGQGDPANDNIVRATLSSLSIEDIDSQDEYGNTLLLLACQYRCEDLVRIMLKKGSDSNAINSSGACCLHFACYSESFSYNIAKILLQNGSNPEVCETSYGCTPLHYCAGTGNLDLCKLVLNNGASIETMDYYNYTCVDYAKEANNEEIASYLQDRLDKYNKVNNITDISGGGSSSKTLGGSIQDWTEYADPISGGKYFIHNTSGECLWENDLKHHIGASGSVIPGYSTPNNKSNPVPLSADDEAKLKHQTFKVRLVAFFGKHDPARLIEIDSLSESYKGKEAELLKELCSKYNVSEEPEIMAFQEKMQELKDSSIKKSAIGFGLSVTTEFTLGTKNNTPSTPSSKAGGGAPPTPGGMDSSMVQSLMNDARIKHETQLNEEKTSFRVTISEKDGLISKFQSQIEVLKKEKEAIQNEIEVIKSRNERESSLGSEAYNKAEIEISKLEQVVSSLKIEITTLKNSLDISNDRIKSSESTLQNLTLGNEELIKKEREAEEERANK
jgi:ankyrin repeat protein